MANPMPAAEVEIDEPLVRRLLAEQAPAFAELSLKSLTSGWDNTIFRLGEDHLVRVPRRQVAVELVEHEQRWLPSLAPQLPIAVPVPVVLGRPTTFFPWPWSVVAHVPGEDAISSPPDPEAAVEVMASFLSAMHVAAPADAPINQWRGCPLVDRVDATAERFDKLTEWLTGKADIDALRSAWQRAVEADAYVGPPMWIHGDLHPGNVIVRDGHIVSIIDFGDLTSGDPATDLGSAWMFFDTTDRLKLRDRLAMDEATWDRARGWALSVSLAIADNSGDNPRYETLSARTLERVATDGG